MKINEDLAAVHAYLCADGYVIKNLSTQKSKYYVIGFRNTNLNLLLDFQSKFKRYFGVEPHLHPGERCVLGSKEIYQKLTDEFGSFYSWEWTMPKLSNKLTKIWLRAYFDCEGWVFCKTHQNRHIGVDCVNKKGFDQVELALNKQGIKTIRKFNAKRKIHRIFIYGRDNLIRFGQKIGFNHPDKRRKLVETLSNFVDYIWSINDNGSNIGEIILVKGVIKKPYHFRIYSKEKINILKIKRILCSAIGILPNSILVDERINGLGTRYFELSINKKKDVQKLIKHNLISQEQLKKIRNDVLKP